MAAGMSSLGDRLTARQAALRDVVAGLGGVRHDLVDVDAVVAHTLRPDNAVGIISSRGLDDGPGRFGAVLDRPVVHSYLLDVDAFGTAVAATLDAQVAGYAIELRRSGTTVWSRIHDAARLRDDPAPPSIEVPWGLGVRMHVASCSKLLTAIAVRKLLAAKGVSPDSPIAPWLPSYWVKGQNVGSITFAHLLTHTSGLVQTKSDSDYGFMKSMIAAGVAAVGGYSYANVNFGLCRILVATLNGDIAPSFTIPLLGEALDDNFWDVITVNAYRDYVTANVFTPAGVVGPRLDHGDSGALAYQRAAAVPGWDSGDLRSMSGAAGWHVSARDLLDVMGTFRRGGQIMSPPAAQAMIDRSFGIDGIVETRAGRLYHKNGYWMDGAGHAEQACVYFLPEDMELAVLANSPYSTGNIPDLRDAVTAAYQSCLKEQMQFPVGPAVQPAFVYAVASDGGLLWYRHDGADTGGGLGTWQGARQVGVGWGDLEHVFSGGGNIIYAIDGAGTLRWYEHNGFNVGDGLDQAGSWAGPREVGVGWSGFEHVFSAGAGVIYVVTADGALRWYRHNAIADGGGLDLPGAWSGPSDVGVGWSGLKFVFSTGDGVIYAVAADGTLRWYRHNRWADGLGLDTPGAWDGGHPVGSGWDQFTAVFSPHGGIIYAVMPDGTLRWYHHTGWRDGQATWDGPHDVGLGWNSVHTPFALLPGIPPVIH